MASDFFTTVEEISERLGIVFSSKHCLLDLNNQLMQHGKERCANNMGQCHWEPMSSHELDSQGRKHAWHDISAANVFLLAMKFFLRTTFAGWSGKRQSAPLSPVFINNTVFLATQASLPASRLIILK